MPHACGAHGNGRTLVWLGVGTRDFVPLSEGAPVVLAVIEGATVMLLEPEGDGVAETETVLDSDREGVGELVIDVDGVGELVSDSEGDSDEVSEGVPLPVSVTLGVVVRVNVLERDCVMDRVRLQRGWWLVRWVGGWGGIGASKCISTLNGAAAQTWRPKGHDSRVQPARERGLTWR